MRGVVVHLLNEQPVVADLFGYPGPGDVTLVCTNVKSTNGKRPVWADSTDGIFYFPWSQIRFVEMPPSRTVPSSADDAGTVSSAPAPEEADLEIDEAFLRRVRDV